MARRRYHDSYAGKRLSKYYRECHTKRLRKEWQHLCLRLGVEACVFGEFPPETFRELCVEVNILRRRMVGMARRRGFVKTPNSHYWAWFYTTDERRMQNLACGYNCTMDMADYKNCDARHGNRVHL